MGMEKKGYRNINLRRIPGLERIWEKRHNIQFASLTYYIVPTTATLFISHAGFSEYLSISKVISMSGDKLLQWTSPLPSSSGNGAKKMEVVEFRRSRDSGIYYIIIPARTD